MQIQKNLRSCVKIQSFILWNIKKILLKKVELCDFGSYPCNIKKGSLAEKVYGKEKIEERHRHRFEYNNDYRKIMESKGLKIGGTSPDGSLVEMVELENHPYFIGVQFHPEFTSRPNRPTPLFMHLIKEAKIIE